MKTRKEIKEQYKDSKPIAGVFQIQNNQNGKTLIDAATDLYAKWNRHRSELRFGSHRNKQLQIDWNDIGEDNFSFSTLSELKPTDKEGVDIQNEVKILKSMVEEELSLSNDMKY